MRKLLLSVLFVMFGISAMMAQAQSTLLFLRINPGARQAAMGDAGVALADDSYAIFFNPAGLAYQHNPEDATSYPGEASFTYAQWLPGFNLNDIYYFYGSGRYDFAGLGTFGVSVQFFNYGKIERRGEGGENLGDFSSNETAFSLAYSLLLRDNLSFGSTLKFIYSNLSPVGAGTEGGDGRATAFGLDLGVLYKWRTFNFGAAISNMGPNVTYKDQAQADPMPTVMRLGVAYKILDNPIHRLTVTYEVNRELTRRRGVKADDFPKSLISTWGNDNNLGLFTHGLGMEYWYTDLVAMRAGYFYERPDNGDRRFISLGMGMKYLFLGLDLSYIYALKDFDPLSDTVRISTLFHF